MNWKEESYKSCKKYNYPFKDFCMHLRIAITGKKVGPPLFESMDILGVEECLKRLDYYFFHVL